MGQETNAESIRTLERQIENGEGDIIKLKRARNSLLNISTLAPPEILGEVFSWILFRRDPVPNDDSRFNWFCKGSYNFLLVCHHWFQVASHTPTLWTYCGNTLQHWKKWLHLHPQVTPLNLVLNDITPGATRSIDHTVQDALKDLAARDAIRQVHLRCRSRDLLSQLISFLTPKGEAVQWRSIESIDLEHTWGVSPFDVSDFFARVHLPKLRSLLLHGPLILSSWNHLAHQTNVLTTLSLRIKLSSPSPPPTTSQLFTILISNPGLQVLSLDSPVIPEDDDDKFVSQVPLQHLKKLYLNSQLHHAVKILERLAFPYPLNTLEVAASKSVVESVLKTLGLFVRLYFQSNRFLWDRLELAVLAIPTAIKITVEIEHGADLINPLSANFKVYPTEVTPREVMRSLCRDLVAFVPQERVCSLRTSLPLAELEDLFIAMPNIENLVLFFAGLSEGFLQPNPDGPHSKSKLLPSLRSLHLIDCTLINHNWGPLTAFLGHQTSGSLPISLRITSTGSHMCPDVAKQIRDLAGEFTLDAARLVGGKCPLGRCKGDAEDGIIVVE